MSNQTADHAAENAEQDEQHRSALEPASSAKDVVDACTYDEMLAKAKEVFGEDADVHFASGQWVIETGVQEEVDLAPFEGTPALAAYNTPEASYGNDLERWMAKNGHYGSSVAEGMRAYNESVEHRLKESVALVRKTISDGMPFDWEGGPEYRDQMLRLAEENGW